MMVYLVIEADADPACGYSVVSVHASLEGAEAAKTAAFERAGQYARESDFDVEEQELLP